MEQDVFKKMLKEKGLKVTGQRLLVLETMGAHLGEHLTAEEIFELARTKSPEIGLATIYRALQMLVNLHVVRKVSFDDGFARYELSRNLSSERHHHHHAICLGCKTVFSLEEDLLEPLEEKLKERLGFDVTDHEVKLYGYCRVCREKDFRAGLDKAERLFTTDDKLQKGKRTMKIKKKELEDSD